MMIFKIDHGEFINWVVIMYSESILILKSIGQGID
jgi:hypothetical protein